MNRKETTYRTIMWTVFAIGAACSGLDFGCGGAVGGGGGTPGASTPSGTMRGHVNLKVTMPIPEDKRAVTRANRAEIEAMGYTVAEDGSAVAFADISPAGWEITLGDESAFIEETGDFSIEVVEGGSTEGQIIHPSEEEVVAVFSVDQLAAEGETPTTIVISVEFPGGCCMTPEDGCCPTDSAASSASRKTDLKFVPTSKTNPTFNWGFCLLTDGPLTNVDSLLGYFGSTCSKRVDQGCCPNEGGMFVSAIFTSLKTTTCIDNHKGGYCQELLPGDVVMTPSGLIDVELGGTVDVKVHNNGCFGRTHISRSGGSLAGTLTGTGYVS